MFHPITSFVSLVESVPANTCTFCSVSKSQFCIEISSNNGYVSFAICCVLLDRLVLFLDVMVRIPRVGKYTLISLMRWRLTTIVVVMARSLMYLSVHNSLPPLLVQHDSNAVFVVISSCTHENVFVMCLPYFCFVLSPRFTQYYCFPSVAFELAFHFFDSFT